MITDVKDDLGLEELHKIKNTDRVRKINDEINKIKSTNNSKILFSVDKEQVLFEELKHGNRDRVFTILEEIFNDMLHSGLKEKLITTRCLEIIIMGSKVVVDGGLNLETRLYLNDQLIKMMDKAVEIQDKFNLTKYFLQRYIDLVHDRQEIENLATVRKIQRFIKRNYSEKLTLDQIADHVYLSASYLCKIFKDVTSITIIEYLTQIRLKEAKRLLRKTEMSLRDIAQLCGYYDASYFSKVFKRETGVTPGQYRKNMKN